MRKNVLIFALLLPAFAVAQPLSDGNYLIPVDHLWGLPKYLDLKAIYPADYNGIYGVLYNGHCFLHGYTGHGKTLVYSTMDVQYGDDGYCYVSNCYNSIVEPLILVFGGDTIIPVGKYIYSNPGEHLLGNDFTTASYFRGGPENAYERFSRDDEEYDSAWLEGASSGGGSGLWDDGISSISAWSTLNEVVKGLPVSYDAKRMRFPFYQWGDAELNFNNASLFWAEGEKGPGIGGTIKVEFKRKTDHVMVLNGAVDIARLNLYKDNNRLKRVLVKGDAGAFAIEYTFEDVVQFHKISFPKEVEGITITILDVYKGRKWDDTCVSAIFLKQPPLRPRAEYEAVIESYIRLRGFDKLIEEYEKSHGGKKQEM